MTDHQLELTFSAMDYLKANNIKVAQLAKELGVSRQAVYQSIDGEGSRRIRVRIARLLGVKPSELWTENDKEQLRIDDMWYAFDSWSGDGDAA